MNIVSTMVGLSIMGAAAPSMMTMSIAPFEAQKRAQNLGVAESAAVIYAAENEGKTTLTAVPNSPRCDLDRTNAPAYEITCSEGDAAYEQTVSRSFSQIGPGTSPTTPGRTFDYPAPTLGFTSTYCLTWEDWGTNSSAFDKETNTWVGKSCTPFETTAQSRYALSDVEAWRYDINKINGFGPHSGY